MNDLTVTEERVPKVQHDMLMLKVIETGNVEALERFIALREREETRQASLEFDRHFAEMQAEFIPASRSKKGYDYRYAPIEALQKQYGPIISAHGFSYRWKEESIETGKRCTLIISGWGSSRENSFDVPRITGTKQMNPIQVAGAMSTYGRRYTFISGFGVIIEDEDTDGIPEGTGAEFANEASSLSSCGTLQELMASWKTIYPKVRNNPGAMRYLTGIKDDMKKKLGGK